MIEPLAGAEVVMMGGFPGYDAGSETVRGVLLKRDAKSSQAYSDDVPYTHAIAVTGILTGLPPSEQGSVHVHNGVTCDPGLNDVNLDPALKHFRAANGFDPWLSPSISWTADGNGVATVDLNAPGLSVYGAQAAYGRVVIVHLGDLNIGCGGQKLVGPTFSPPPSPPPSPPVSPLPRSPPAPPPAAPPPLVFTFDPSLPYAIVEIGQYPGVTSRTARGTLAVQSSGGSLHFNGFVTGLEPGQKGGWHVHLSLIHI